MSINNTVTVFARETQMLFNNLMQQISEGDVVERRLRNGLGHT
jgi:hypothetical protein